MNRDEKLRRIEKLHRHEREFQKEIGKIDKQIAELLKRKKKLQKNASGAYIYRSQLINEAYQPPPPTEKKHSE